MLMKYSRRSRDLRDSYSHKETLFILVLTVIHEEEGLKTGTGLGLRWEVYLTQSTTVC